MAPKFDKVLLGVARCGAFFALLVIAAAGRAQDRPPIPVLHRCPTVQCQVILSPSGGDDTAAIRTALTSNSFVCLAGGQQNPFRISSPIVVPSGKTLAGYRGVAAIRLPQYRSPTDPGFSTAVVVHHGAIGAAIQCLDIDGGYPESCIPASRPRWNDPSFGALVLVGHDVQSCSITKCTLRNPAGWTALQWGYRGAANLIADVEVRNAGYNLSENGTSFWADGISLYAGDIDVVDNAVVDATDQAIVAFHDGPRIRNNIVRVENRYAFGAFAFVDSLSHRVTLEANKVVVSGGQLGVAFAFGSALWDCGKCFLSDFSGAVIRLNEVQYMGGFLGYAFVVNGAKNLVFSADNSILAGPSFVPAGQGCGVSKWPGGSFFVGSFVTRNPSRCGQVDHLGCQNCTLAGGPWSGLDPLKGVHLIGPFPDDRNRFPRCGF